MQAYTVQNQHAVLDCCSFGSIKDQLGSNVGGTIPCGQQYHCCGRGGSPLTVAQCSFDIVKDQLGGPRRAFPHSMMMVAGTQAATARANYLALMRLSNLGQVRNCSGIHKRSPLNRLSCEGEGQGHSRWNRALTARRMRRSTPGRVCCTIEAVVLVDMRLLVDMRMRVHGDGWSVNTLLFRCRGSTQRRRTIATPTWTRTAAPRYCCCLAGLACLSDAHSCIELQLVHWKAVSSGRLGTLKPKAALVACANRPGSGSMMSELTRAAECGLSGVPSHAVLSDLLWIRLC